MLTKINCPLPSKIIENLKKLRNYIPLGSRLLLTPVSFLSRFLNNNGYFYGYDVLGLSDIEPEDRKTHFYPASTIESFSLQDVNFDYVVLCDLSNSINANYITQNISPHCKICNLCGDCNIDDYRKEVSSFFYGINFPITNKNINYEIMVPDDWGFGDMLLALSATRKIKKLNPDLNICYNQLPHIRDAYGDNLVPSGKGIKIALTSPFHWWEKKGTISKNYYDNYLLRLGVYEKGYPLPEFPVFEPFPELENKRYIVLQSRCGSIYGLPHLPQEALQEIIDASPVPVYHAGKWLPELNLKNVNRSYQSRMDMLRLISHASLVLTARSASVNIAAAYGIPTIAWLPNDILDWQLDFPDWQCKKIVMDDNFSSSMVVEAAKEYFQKYLREN